MFVDVINLLIAAHVVLVDKYTVFSVDFSMCYAKVSICLWLQPCLAKTLNPRVAKPERGARPKGLDCCVALFWPGSKTCIITKLGIPAFPKAPVVYLPHLSDLMICKWHANDDIFVHLLVFLEILQTKLMTPRRCRINFNAALMVICLVTVAWGRSTYVKVLGAAWWMSWTMGQSGFVVALKISRLTRWSGWFSWFVHLKCHSKRKQKHRGLLFVVTTFFSTNPLKR